MKNIAFVMNNMTSGGVQVSIINLLRCLKQYDVNITLFITSNSGVYTDDIPENVKVIQIFNDDIIQNDNVLFYNPIYKDDSISLKIKKVFHKLINKIDKQHINKYLLKKSIRSDNKFDYVIDYLGYGSFCSYYTLFGINSYCKITFIHDEKVEWINNLKDMYLLFDKIFCVSNSCKKIIDNIFPEMKKHTKVCRNVIDKDKIINMSSEKCELFSANSTKILTIGRLEYQKGYDMLVKVAKLLKDNQIDYKWYIIGSGSLENEIKNKISKNNLESNIILLGTKKNPYKYLKNADIYVQTSRHEGYGIAIAEARVLNKPIVSTNLNCVTEQITNNSNGILCSFDENEFCNAILNLINDKKFYNSIVTQLKKENINDTVDIVDLLELKVII